MDSTNVSDDELVESVCMEDNKVALSMLFDRHARYLHVYISSWLNNPEVWRHGSNKQYRDQVARILVITSFTSLWDCRDVLLDEIDGIKDRLAINKLDDLNTYQENGKKNRTVRAYLVDLIRRRMYSLSRSYEKDITRKSAT